MIDYPSAQDGTILTTRDYTPCPVRKISPKLNSKSLTKLFRSRWLDIILVRFLRFSGLGLRLGPKTSKKELGQYRAISTPRLVNNPYVKHSRLCNKRPCSVRLQNNSRLRITRGFLRIVVCGSTPLRIGYVYSV